MSRFRHYITKADVVLIITLLLVGIALTIAIYRPRQTDGAYLEVRQGGTVIMSLPLDQDTKQTITDDDGHTNTFTITDGVVTMTEADCNDQTCVCTQGIRSPGRTIVCLPHRLVLAIVSGDDASDTLDAIVQ